MGKVAAGHLEPQLTANYSGNNQVQFPLSSPLSDLAITAVRKHSDSPDTAGRVFVLHSGSVYVLQSGPVTLVFRFLGLFVFMASLILASTMTHCSAILQQERRNESMEALHGVAG